MKSTTDNISNPMVVDTLNLYTGINSGTTRNVIVVSPENYELIKSKDPNTIYIVNNPVTKSRMVYLGESIIEEDASTPIYLLGPSDKFGEYTLYLNQSDGKSDKLIKICRYNDPQIAITELNKFNRVGSHNQLNLQIYNIIASYIQKDISLNDMILGIISAFGYRDDQKMHYLIQLTMIYDASGAFKDIPKVFKKVLKDMGKYSKNHLIGIYLNLYDLMDSYKFFQTKEFQKDPEELDLSKVIRKVIKIMTPAP